MPVITRLSTEAVTRPLVSTSETVSVPVPVKAALVSARSAVSGPLVIAGASLVPVMVMVTVSVSLAAVSSALTVYVNIRVSPVAR